jgi:uncharacterized protein (DUF433 family)
MVTRRFSLDSLLVSKPGYRQGRPCLRGTGITVHSVAVAHLMGLTAEEICNENPDLDPSLFFAGSPTISRTKSRSRPTSRRTASTAKP